MINKLYSIRDIKTDNYDSPVDAPNDATAIRFFKRVLQQVPLMRDSPEDFNLHAVGTFNTKNGVIHCLPAIQFIASGLDCSQSTTEAKQDEKTKVSNDAPIQSSTESGDTTK